MTNAEQQIELQVNNFLAEAMVKNLSRQRDFKGSNTTLIVDGYIWYVTVMRRPVSPPIKFPVAHEN